jgi:hypothetical protein
VPSERPPGPDRRLPRLFEERSRVRFREGLSCPAWAARHVGFTKRSVRPAYARGYDATPPADLPS